MTRNQLACSLLLAVSIACGSGSQATYPASTTSALLGQKLPSLARRRTLDGESLEASLTTGKPVLVKFFADYCEPCKETLPAAEKVHREHPEVLFVGIAEDESPSTARAVAERYGLTFPVVHDAGNVLSGRFRVSAMPATFVADSDGTIRWVGGAGQTETDLRQAVTVASKATH